MFLEALSAAKDLGCVHEIASILVHCGFGDVVRRIGLSHALETAGKTIHWKYAQETACLLPHQRARRALEKLGPPLSSSWDRSLPPVSIFSPRNGSPNLSYCRIRRHQLNLKNFVRSWRRTWGDAPEEVFAEFDRQPLAAASIAQVHRARLMDGTPVVVKIRRPGIKRVVESDLRLMERLAQILTRDNPGTHRFRPKEVVHQFTLSPRRELDLAHECRNATRIASKLTKGDHIVVPKVY